MKAIIDYLFTIVKNHEYGQDVIWFTVSLIVYILEVYIITVLITKDSINTMKTVFKNTVNKTGTNDAKLLLNTTNYFNLKAYDDTKHKFDELTLITNITSMF
jgi:hypothetical protein